MCLILILRYHKSLNVHLINIPPFPVLLAVNSVAEIGSSRRLDKPCVLARFPTVKNYYITLYTIVAFLLGK